MRELKIGRSLIENRHRRGITQDELAAYIGVSKTAVSKWETGNTYPDIMLLPQLAAFFNISIDELIGYEPQMTKEDIRSLYRQICHDFSEKPFDEVMDFCRKTAKKYFACPPLLFQLGSLYVNHCMLTETPAQTVSVLEEAVELFIRVKEESDDISLKTQAIYMEAFCLLQCGKACEVLELLDTPVSLHMTAEPLISRAYQMTGNEMEARRVLQAGIYQTVVELLNLLLPYLELCEKSAMEETCRRIFDITESFHFKKLHPSILLTVYISAAQAYMKHKNKEQALNILARYSALATSNIYPLCLHGDTYFDLLDGWLEEHLALGRDLPREESAIRRSLAEALINNPAFSTLADDAQFQTIVRRLRAGTEV